MRRRVLILTISTTTLTVFALAVVYDNHSRRAEDARDATVLSSQIAALRKDLPTGTLKSEVKAYLDREEIPHSDKSTRIVALLRGKARAKLIRTDIQLQFDFDDTDRLVALETKEIYTGP